MAGERAVAQDALAQGLAVGADRLAWRSLYAVLLSFRTYVLFSNSSIHLFGPFVNRVGLEFWGRVKAGGRLDR